MSEIPKLTPENYREAYEFYKHHPIDHDAAMLGHRLTALALRPRTTWEPGAEQETGDWLQDGGQVFLASHHISTWDTLLPAAVAEQEEVLHPVRANTFIVAKKEVFTWPLKTLVTELGGVPVLRPSKTKGNVTDELREDNKRCFTEMLSYRADKGQNVAGFPHGTFSRAPRNRVSNLRPGIFEGILESDSAENFIVAPFGVQYLWWYARPLRIRVHIGRPVHVRKSESGLDLVSRFEPALQTAVYAASKS